MIANNGCPAANEADREPAGRLRLELETRITSQRLHYRSGNEEAAAQSVFKLFATSREAMEKHWQAKAFRWITLRMLNDTVRPYTARWNGWMVEEKFPNEMARSLFRTELARLQTKLKLYIEAFAALEEAGLPAADVLKQLEAEQRQATRGTSTCLGSMKLAAGIQDQVPFAGEIEPEDINRTEHQEIMARRVILGRADSWKPGEPLLNASGLAFSGGGIRSATFCLGVTQVLARNGILKEFDYISTVSGGGYLGSFLSCAIGTQATDPPRDKRKDAPPLQTVKTREELARDARKTLEDAFRGEGQRESGLIRHLRNNSKYLLNGGVFARFEMAGLVMTGILSNLMIILPLPLLAACLIYYGDILADIWGAAFHVRSSPFPWLSDPAGRLLIVPASCLGVLWILLPLIQLLNHGKRPGSKGAALRRGWELVTLYAGIFTAAAVVIFFLPALFFGYARLCARLPDWLRGLPFALTGLSAAGVVALGVLLTVLKSHWRRVRAIVVSLFILSGPIFLLLTFLLVGQYLGLGELLPAYDFTYEWYEQPGFIVTTVTGGLIVWAWLCININTLALHRFYRARLCECYLARRLPEGAEKVGFLRRAAGEWSQGRTAALKHLPLTHLGTTQAAPYHLINTTVNLPSSDNKELRGRNGDFFLISKHFCGCPVAGYTHTGTVEKIDPHLDLGTAMAVSGAAASTNMGWKTLANFRFLMTIFNIRLGYWLRWPPEKALHRFVVGPGPWYLFREMLGWANEHCRYLNLSDGGHIENLAVYELLRRRCKFIVCVDAGHEPKMECADLMRLQRYASIDLGIKMEIKTSDLALVNGLSRAYAVLVLIDYNPPSNNSDAEQRDWSKAELGWMLYVKLAVTGSEPGYVLDYRRENPEFPHQSTGDQIYDEAQFEAYRQLGECAMESLLREELVGSIPPRTMEEWFGKLAANLLPDNHPLFSCDAAPCAAEGVRVNGEVMTAA